MHTKSRQLGEMLPILCTIPARVPAGQAVRPAAQLSRAASSDNQT